MKLKKYNLNSSTSIYYDEEKKVLGRIPTHSNYSLTKSGAPDYDLHFSTPKNRFIYEKIEKILSNATIGTKFEFKFQGNDEAVEYGISNNDYENGHIQFNIKGMKKYFDMYNTKGYPFNEVVLLLDFINKEILFVHKTEVELVFPYCNSDFYFPILKTLKKSNVNGEKLSNLYSLVKSIMIIDDEMSNIMLENNTEPHYTHKIRLALSELESRGYVENFEREMWRITEEGIKHLEGSDDLLQSGTQEFLSINKIYYGAPGCGKSYKVQEKYVKELCNNDDKKYERITFHPEYTNSDFVGQISPKLYIDEGDNNKKKISYEFKEGPFSRVLGKAYSNPNDEFFLIIEEINRGNAPAIFGDVFQLLDRKSKDDDCGKKGDSQYSINNVELEEYLAKNSNGNFKEGQKIIIPRNLSIIATMNTSDQNVFTLDTAFKRRWKTERVGNVFDEQHPYKDMKIPGTNVTWKEFVEEINKEILKEENGFNGEDKQIGLYFIGEDELVNETTVNIANVAQLFADKMFSYLWEDALKYNRKNVFGDQITTLDHLIKEFIECKDNNPLSVFKNIEFKPNGDN